MRSTARTAVRSWSTSRTGAASKLRGDPAHPVTRGFLCGKVAQYLEREYSPGRLLYPQRRVGRQGRRAVRADLLGRGARHHRRRGCRPSPAEFGPEAILPYSYAGTMGYLNFGGMDRRFFHRLGASRLDRTICSTAGMARDDRGARHPLCAPSPSSSATRG